MAHDSTKTALGSTEDSDRTVDVYDSDPADFPAGLAVRLNDEGKLSVAVGDGQLVGVSLGRSLSDHKKTAVLRCGNKVPILLTDDGSPHTLVKGGLTFTAVEDGGSYDSYAIEMLDTGTAGDEEVTGPPGNISISADSGVSTATQIKAAWDASPEASALFTCTITPGQEAVAQVAFAADNPFGGQNQFGMSIELGSPVYLDDVTGMAAVTGTITGATYISAMKDGVKEDATEAKVALIDMGGGL